MPIRLNQIQDWPERAKQAKWSATTLAKNCGVCRRTLERYFLKERGLSPKQWLAEQRQLRANDLIRAGFGVKETAFYLGYKHAHHFSRDFTAKWSHRPSEAVSHQSSSS
jgi:transcriptional regulator GlxA family with amidase domain